MHRRFPEWSWRADRIWVDFKGATDPLCMQFTPTQKRIAAWLAIGLVALAATWSLGAVLAPFVVAAVMAYALNPVVNWLDNVGRGRIPRVLAVLIVEIVFALLVLGVLLLIVPILAKELPLMREQLPALLDSLNQSLKPWLAQWGIHIKMDANTIRAFVVKYLNTNFEDVFSSLIASLQIGGSVAFAIIGNAILVPVALFYLLLEWDDFLEATHSLVPPRLRDGTGGFLREADAVLGQYLRGQLLVMGVLAVYYSVGLALFGLDLALPIGIFTGLAVFVPYLGFGVGMALAILAGLLEFSSTAGLGYTVTMVAVVYGVGQVLESFVLTPRLVGERIGLHPLAVIFALLAFGQLFGFVGVLIALPVSAVLLVAIRRLRDSYLRSGLYQG